jgi:hypothetical protein
MIKEVEVIAATSIIATFSHELRRWIAMMENTGVCRDGRWLTAEPDAGVPQ